MPRKQTLPKRKRNQNQLVRPKSSKMVRKMALLPSRMPCANRNLKMMPILKPWRKSSRLCQHRLRLLRRRMKWSSTYSNGYSNQRRLSRQLRKWSHMSAQTENAWTPMSRKPTLNWESLLRKKRRHWVTKFLQKSKSTCNKQSRRRWLLMKIWIRSRNS